MKACVLRKQAPIEDNPLDYSDVSTPDPGPGEVLVRVKACGICRTDLHVVERLGIYGFGAAGHVVIQLQDANRALNALKNQAIAGAGVLVVEE